MKQEVRTGPFILAIETATSIGSVAVMDRDQLLAVMEVRKDRTHAKLIAPMIQTILSDLELSMDQLSAVAVSAGPGSYTGLRVGVSTAKGLCMAQDLPLISVGSLELLASGVQDLAKQLDAWICPMLDARRMEVYAAVFDSEMNPQQEVKPVIMEAGTLDELLADRKIIFVGDGVQKCIPLLKEHPNAILLPKQLSSAADMAMPAWEKFEQKAFEDLVAYEPFYLKSFVATKSKKKFF
ncbi:tRNA (adenosine(37)-N6)-threonylcarbamoyltransferase complex dimerization subunit type 1 TsaB [Pontibacter sp. G13]|uniref:tRNA (adenosine(37)-N6)-threonylcarbamoyltransferase complex dimerization subunit type 1 TsaB n=1 Tax=Pontibacter sp. G13 TaxID=3074898 RepID=UPI00288A019F|nr:tRNA (adenosine(37)-N6)-threonylcarbamoyltransferase complex dimerization subunit type 1 TsaB [Pontibacter sp. G13]WNJ21474.1 tRNA (adenosine(37)-N6)-threonylcarbamoyltransferase complex dimerization subunit type 1 TsaB [Pontibacter sp. G13]